MEILPKEIKIKEVEKRGYFKIYKAKMDLDELLIFNPNKCLHRAGIPKKVMRELNNVTA